MTFRARYALSKSLGFVHRRPKNQGGTAEFISSLIFQVIRGVFLCIELNLKNDSPEQRKEFTHEGKIRENYE